MKMLRTIYFSSFFMRLWPCIVVYGFLAFSYARAAEFGVNGNIVCSVLKLDGQVYTNYSYSFTALVGESGWNVKVHFGTDYYLSTGSDNTNVYYILEDPRVRKTPQSPMPGWVSGSCYPLNGDWYTTIPWLAFCSYTYIDNLATNNLPAPWANPRVDPTAGIYLSQIGQTNADPKLPSKIIFRVAERLKNNVANLGWLNSDSLKEDTLKMLEFYKDGFVGGEYEVEEWTNFNGAVFPSKFELKHYAPDSGHLDQVFSGTANEVFQPTNVSFLPEIKSPVFVSDFRFRNTSSEINFIHYSLTNGDWTLPETLNLQASFDEKQRRANQMGIFNPTMSGRSELIRRVILGVMVITTLLPLFIWWRISRNKKKK
jgi:hypothetical protein